LAQWIDQVRAAALKETASFDKISSCENELATRIIQGKRPV
jgi:hypothetical protein